MKLKYLVAFFLLLILTGAAQAQNLPPAIVSVSVNPASVTMPQAEAENIPITFTWAVVGLRPSDTFLLQSLRLNTWETITALGENAYTTFIRPSLTFAPPTYRLVIVDEDQNVVDLYIVTVPYTVDLNTQPPVIETFTTNASATAPSAEEIPVAWRVLNRQATHNLVFEQVLADGSVVSGERERANLWVPSSGQGSVAIQPEGEIVTLRLSIVDLIEGSVLDQVDLQVNVPAQEAITPTPTAAPTAVVTPGSGDNSTQTGSLEIASLRANKEQTNYGDTISVSWIVNGASSIKLSITHGFEPATVLGTDLPREGSFDYTLPTLQAAYYRADLLLEAQNEAGETQQKTFTVYMNCPVPFFFSPLRVTTFTCPTQAAQTVEVAFQYFEGGFMFWRSDTRQIYVLYGSSQFSIFPDSYAEGEALDIPPAPNDLVAPVRGFGKVWAQNDPVQTALGWATSAEQGYSTPLQTTSYWKTFETYMQLPDERVIFLKAEGTYQGGGVWGYVD